jgi:hypothetical protein
VPVSRFAVTYERNGGLAPSPDKLVVRRGRRAAVKTTSAAGVARTVRFRLSVLTVKRLRNALSQPPFATWEGVPANGCADCYVYTLDFRGHSVSFPQNEIPIWLRKTVRRFEALVEAHRPFH